MFDRYYILFLSLRWSVWKRVLRDNDIVFRHYLIWIRKLLQLAIPSIISNITVPLLGLIDVAIVGHLGSASYIGAIAVGRECCLILSTGYSVSPYGDKRYDFPSVRETGFDGSYPDLIPVCRGWFPDIFGAFDTSIPYLEGCVYFDRRNGGGKTMGLSS